ncbi:hypothetical protein BJX70DRAFT_45556 [Aspergillus crustosus]
MSLVTPPPAAEQPQERPRSWMWDFNEIRLGLPADGVTEIGVMECWKYNKEAGTTTHVARKTESFKQDQIVARLQQPVPLHEGIPPSSGFQIAIVPCSFQSLPRLGISGLDALNEALGLPDHNHHYSSVRSGAIGMFLLPDNTWFLARPRAPDFTSITTMLRYDPLTNITRGVFYADTGFLYFRHLVPEFEKCSHPLLLPVLALEMTLNTNVYHLEMHQTTLERMENATKADKENQDGTDNHIQNYRTLVKDLSKARNDIHLALATLRSTQWGVEYILTKIPWVDAKLRPEIREQLSDASRQLTERTEFTLSTIQHAIQRGGVKERLEGQHFTLSNLITQNDSLLSTSIAQDSREIAAASKRDSSSMKILAFLTTFFLPGTFAATFFSMPMFNWSADSVNDATGPHFWVYWALTAPLTIATMAGAVAWAFWHSKQTQRTEKRARENFSQAIADEAQQLKRAATMRTMEVTENV